MLTRLSGGPTFPIFSGRKVLGFRSVFLFLFYFYEFTVFSRRIYKPSEWKKKKFILHTMLQSRCSTTAQSQRFHDTHLDQLFFWISKNFILDCLVSADIVIEWYNYNTQYFWFLTEVVNQTTWNPLPQAFLNYVKSHGKIRKRNWWLWAYLDLKHS